ncbi:hypothetical protein [Paenibacillus sp. SAF-054]|uniref:hypothetical protein n=1 Tax=Paenibacillus sp. SAF-054 TaxID=3436863 RepID=UPI003F7E534F
MPSPGRYVHTGEYTATVSHRKRLLRGFSDSGVLEEEEQQEWYREGEQPVVS